MACESEDLPVAGIPMPNLSFEPSKEGLDGDLPFGCRNSVEQSACTFLRRVVSVAPVEVLKTAGRWPAGVVESI